jgi:hypothetical protein
MMWRGQNPINTWRHAKVWKVMATCMIIHNMIIEKECDNIKYDQQWDFEGELVAPRLDHR